MIFILIVFWGFSDKEPPPDIYSTNHMLSKAGTSSCKLSLMVKAATGFTSCYSYHRLFWVCYSCFRLASCLNSCHSCHKLEESQGEKLQLQSRLSSLPFCHGHHCHYFERSLKYPTKPSPSVPQSPLTLRPIEPSSAS